MHENSAGIVSVDMETLGHNNDAVLISLGVIYTPWVAVDTFQDLVKASKAIYLEFNIAEQITHYKRTTTQSVVEWWHEQSPDAKEALKPKDTDVSIAQLPEILDEFFRNRCMMKWRDCDTYDRKSYDVSKLQHVWEEELNVESGVPWNYGHVYEFGTALTYLGAGRYGNIRPDDVPGLIYHRADHDALLDSYRLLKNLTLNGVLK